MNDRNPARGDELVPCPFWEPRQPWIPIGLSAQAPGLVLRSRAFSRAARIRNPRATTCH